MSYPFEHGDETLWDAGYRSGRLYHALAQGAAGFDRVGGRITVSPRDTAALDEAKARLARTMPV
ncbi:hypothetical protein [Streptomyces collinus]|uniref:hypothetical protein n=1 Tax=Streptomyces collinus TaxID=42684 RepID=UPI002941BB91|nr:hypothetical protein [Streptomyces collinus]